MRRRTPNSPLPSTSNLAGQKCPEPEGCSGDKASCWMFLPVKATQTEDGAGKYLLNMSGFRSQLSSYVINTTDTFNWRFTAKLHLNRDITDHRIIRPVGVTSSAQSRFGHAGNHFSTQSVFHDSALPNSADSTDGVWSVSMAATLRCSSSVPLISSDTMCPVGSPWMHRRGHIIGSQLAA